jgi:hypothetical protein
MLNTRRDTSEKGRFFCAASHSVDPGGRIGWGWFRFARLLSACMAIPASADAHPAKQPNAE